MMTSRAALTAALAALSLTTGARIAHADSLAEAIALAYQTNPNLQALRAQQRALDENYVDAAAGLRPTVSTTLSASYERIHLGKEAANNNRIFNPTASAISELNGNGARISLAQPLYNGGRTAAQIASVKDSIEAGRQGLRVSEGDLLLNVVDAYTSVIRDEASFAVRQVGLSASERQADEARARRTAGEVTLTDVSQAEAQLENERAFAAQARQQLNVSRLNYAALVGRNPGTLEAPPPLPKLPATVDQAFDLADVSNPDLKQAIAAELASREQIRLARAQGRPTVSAQVTYGYTGAADPFVGRNLERDLTAQALLTQPLFTGGQVSAGIRRAIEQNNSDRFTVERIRRSVVQAIGNAWNQMLTARADVATQERQVAAAQSTYDGMQAEYRAGLRSTFDVLYAEQVLRNAEILRLQARHDAYVGEAAVLRYIGLLEVSSLTTGVPAYDPTVNFRRAQHEAALPWDPVVQALDGLAGPGVGQRPLQALPATDRPAIVPADPGAPIVQTSVDASALPLDPLPGTTADGRKPGAASVPGSERKPDAASKPVDGAVPPADAK